MPLLASPFYTPSKPAHDARIFDTKETPIAKQTSENKKLTCRVVCDKKIYKEQKIAEAISYYKSSNYYVFSLNN